MSGLWHGTSLLDWPGLVPGLFLWRGTIGQGRIGGRGDKAMFDLVYGLVLSTLVFLAVLGLEEWAYFKTSSKVTRSLITGAAAFVLFLALHFFWPSAVF
jgi:hypothetical protein